MPGEGMRRVGGQSQAELWVQRVLLQGGRGAELCLAQTSPRGTEWHLHAPTHHGLSPCALRGLSTALSLMQQKHPHCRHCNRLLVHWDGGLHPITHPQFLGTVPPHAHWGLALASTLCCLHPAGQTLNECTAQPSFPPLQPLLEPRGSRSHAGAEPGNCSLPFLPPSPRASFTSVLF